MLPWVWLPAPTPSLLAQPPPQLPLRRGGPLCPSGCAAPKIHVDCSNLTALTIQSPRPTSCQTLAAGHVSVGGCPRGRARTGFLTGPGVWMPVLHMPGPHWPSRPWGPLPSPRRARGLCRDPWSAALAVSRPRCEPERGERAGVGEGKGQKGVFSVRRGGTGRAGLAIGA